MCTVSIAFPGAFLVLSTVAQTCVLVKLGGDVSGEGVGSISFSKATVFCDRELTALVNCAKSGIEIYCPGQKVFPY